jgi:transposase-like protein
MDTNENTTPGRASYTEEERRELIEEFKSSDLTQAAFCREWNLNSKTMARWLRIEREDNEVSFCEVELGNTSASENNVRVHLPNGIEVIVPVGSSQELADVFREAATCLA